MAEPGLAAPLLPALTLLAVPLCAAAQPWSRIECPEADREAHERYEVVRMIDDFEEGVDAWTGFSGGQQAQSRLSRTAEEKRTGRASMRVDFDFTGDKRLEYVEFGKETPLTGPGLGLGFWVKGDGKPLFLRTRVVDRSGETHQYDLASLPAGVWGYVAVEFDGHAEHWGGDGNRRLDYPCRINSILADRPRAGYRGKGTMYVDQVALVRRRKLTNALVLEVAPRRLGNIYEPLDTVRLRANAPRGTVRWRVEDFRGTRIASGDGPAAGVIASLRLPAEGYFEWTFELLSDGRVEDARAFRCGALKKRAPGARNEFVGLCTHFQRRHAWPLEGMDLLARLGLTEIRDEIGWDSVEREKGRLELPRDRAAFLDRAAQLGINVLMIFDYGNRFYDDGGFPNSDEAVAGFARYARTLSLMLKDKVRTFEVWNEWTVKCGMGGKPGSNAPEPYARLLRETYRTVKAARPDVFIVGIGGEHSAHHFDRIERMMASGAARAMDAYSVHSYRYPRSPEATDLAGEIRKVAEMAARHRAPDRLWVTEIGWPTHVGGRGVDERTQARYIVRALSLLRSVRAVKKVHWYDFKNDGLLRTYNENNFGIVWHQRYNWAPKPAALALATFARLTAGARPGALRERNGRYAMHYALGGGTELVIAWCTQGDVAARVRGHGLEAFDIMGNPLPAPQGIRLTQDPVYVRGRRLGVSLED